MLLHLLLSELIARIICSLCHCLPGNYVYCLLVDQLENGQEKVRDSNKINPKQCLFPTRQLVRLLLLEVGW